MKTNTSEMEKKTGSKYRADNRFWRTLLVISTLAGIVLAILQIFLVYPILENAYLYWLLVFFLPPVFIFFPATKRARKDRVPLFDIFLAIVTLLFAAYLAMNSWNITHGGWAFQAPLHVSVVSLILCLVVLEAVRRAGGLPLFLFTAVFACYPLFASVLPGFLKGNQYPFWLVVRYHTMSTESVIGIPMYVVGTLIIGFMIFGAALVSTGGGKFFLDFAFALLGSQRGGPAKVAILSSGFFGSLSGSVISNVITTGSVTIPTMKKTGYPFHYAAAVEACASAGGCIMPPVMGAVAFVMASLLGIPYLQVAIAAAIPAFLYYFGLYAQVDFYARKSGLEGLPKSEIPRILPVLKDGYLYLLAFFLLIYFLYLRQEARSAFYATLAILILAMMRQKTRLSLNDIFKFVQSTGLILSEIVAILAACGFIIGSFSLTGVASSFSRELVMIAGTNALLMLCFGALASFIMGMGMTVTACYIFLSIILVPSLVTIGFNTLAVNLFVLYWGIVSFITPPVALGSYAAASVAGANPMQTGLTSMRLGIVKYIVPFFFVYEPALIMQGQPMEIVYAFITCLIGIFLLAGGLEGYMIGFGKLSYLNRSLCIVSGFLIALPNISTDLISFVIVAISLIIMLISKLRHKRTVLQ